jgi:N-acetylmuramoyl-L-alanine amidase
MAGWHKVAQGECLSSLAAAHHLKAWSVIYNHAENARFRQEHPNPNVIYPGDLVYVPDPERVFKAEPTDQRHTFLRKRDKTMLRIVVQDADGTPYADSDYRLTVGAITYEGKTDGKGMLEQFIDPQAVSAVLTLWWTGVPRRHCTWRLKLGWLDPVHSVSGIQARLNNLGHNSGPVDGVHGRITTAAVKEFQKKHDLTVDGIPGPVTQAKLQEVHGC